MDYPAKVVDLIKDYEYDFGVKLPFEDACRMLILYDMLSELLEEYGGDTGDDSLLSPAFFSRW